MRRIDTQDGMWDPGDPANNVKGSTLRYWWFNATQEEIANAIEGFGVTLDPEENDQLFKIISARAVMPGDEIKLSYVPTAQDMIDRKMMERDGSQLLIADYPLVYAKIGRSFTLPSIPAEYFCLMDDRGIFDRIWDHGAGVDPDASSRTNRGDGTEGDYVGTEQSYEIESHAHVLPLYDSVTQYGPRAGSAAAGATRYQTTNATGGNETRPINRYKWGGIFY